MVYLGIRLILVQLNAKDRIQFTWYTWYSAGSYFQHLACYVRQDSLRVSPCPFGGNEVVVGFFYGLLDLGRFPETSFYVHAS